MPLEGGGHIASDPFSLNLDVRPDLATALNVTEGQVAAPAPPWFDKNVSRDGAARAERRDRKQRTDRLLADP
jgi:hypothetical protein